MGHHVEADPGGVEGRHPNHAHLAQVGYRAQAVPVGLVDGGGGHLAVGHGFDTETWAAVAFRPPVTEFRLYNTGEVLQALRDNGLEDNTLVMFTSDNGGAGYIGLPDVNKPFRGWKISLFEGGIHVPYFIKWPARIPAGTVLIIP